jgi:hypothetical protein
VEYSAWARTNFLSEGLGDAVLPGFFSSISSAADQRAHQYLSGHSAAPVIYRLGVWRSFHLKPSHYSCLPVAWITGESQLSRQIPVFVKQTFKIEIKSKKGKNTSKNHMDILTDKNRGVTYFPIIKKETFYIYFFSTCPLFIKQV